MGGNSSDASVRDTLAKVTAALPGGGEDRPGQIAMAEAVAQAIRRERPLAVQAGTGTGKSLAYLVPCILSGSRVVVATATKALQDQLAGKDLPFLQSVLPVEFTWSLLKGRSNYVCRQKVREVSGMDLSTGAGQLELGSEAGEGVDVEPGRTGRFVDDLKIVIRWSTRSRTGDASELDFEPDPRAWAAVSTSARECPGASKCPSGSSCFAELARHRASQSDVVVTNTHLYGAHLASGGGVLPAHDVVVFDEAHQLEDIAASALGIELSGGSFRSLARLMRPLVGPGELETVESLSAAGEILEEAGHRAPDSPTVGRIEDPLASALLTVAERLNRATAALRAAQAVAEQQSFEAQASDRPDPAVETAKTRSLQSAAALAGDLSRLGAPGPDDVIWVDRADRSPVVKLAPVDVSASLSERLWPEVTAVLTSATLPEALVGRLGLPPEVLDVGSPFPYRENALLYCAAHLPRPGARDAAGAADLDQAIHRELARLIAASRGRALVLFTSWRAMRAAHDHLAGTIAYQAFAQGDLPKHELLRRFGADESSCLFATMSFWQGVDVPGNALSMVVIDRIPFPRPDEPLMAARRERAGTGAFRLVDIPRAATLLAQGAGRLIRSATDRGVVAVLDSRLATAPYRGALLSALPPMRRTVKIEDIEAFFHSPA